MGQTLNANGPDAEMPRSIVYSILYTVYIYCILYTVYVYCIKYIYTVYCIQYIFTVYNILYTIYIYLNTFSSRRMLNIKFKVVLIPCSFGAFPPKKVHLVIDEVCKNS